jgi:hypothetical protein
MIVGIFDADSMFVKFGDAFRLARVLVDKNESFC